jgi:hypothetical protein
MCTGAVYRRQSGRGGQKLRRSRGTYSSVPLWYVTWKHLPLPLTVIIKDTQDIHYGKKEFTVMKKEIRHMRTAFSEFYIHVSVLCGSN